MPVIGSIKRRSYLLGVAGGSGSGKTYFARDLERRLGSALVTIVYQDSFYIDQSKRFDHDGGSVNFDHPSSLDFDLLADCLEELKSGQPSQLPIYDFVTHARRRERAPVQPTPLIVVDGILILHHARVRELLDERLFFDTPEELRFQRRIERDVQERGRTEAGVRQQFYSQVKPMHDQFVEPSRRFAARVIGDDRSYAEALKSIADRFA